MSGFECFTHKAEVGRKKNIQCAVESLKWRRRRGARGLTGQKKKKKDNGVSVDMNRRVGDEESEGEERLNSDTATTQWDQPQEALLIEPGSGDAERDECSSFSSCVAECGGCWRKRI